MMPIRKEGGLYIIVILIAATILSAASVIYPFLTLRIVALVSWVVFIRNEADTGRLNIRSKLNI